ncbi:hypothetical protein vseg_002320 [Gypsophila vaccaria]
MATATPNDDLSRMNNHVHVLMIPYPAPSHITPLLDLTRRLLSHQHSVSVTFLTTPAFLHLLQPLLSSFPPPRLHPLILPPPPSPSPPPPPLSRLRALHSLLHPTLSYFLGGPHTGTTASATTLPPDFIISDFLCIWIHELSLRLNVPRVVFYSSGAFGSAVMYSIWRAGPTNPDDHLDHSVVLDDLAGSPVFKWSELSALFRSGKAGDPDWDYFRGGLMSNLASWGAVFNTFSELENVYIDHFRKVMGHDRVWAVGPLLHDDVVQLQTSGPGCDEVMTWLDGKRDGSVVFVCFGTRTLLTEEESAVLKAALEFSGVHYVWCVRESDGEKGIGFDSNDREHDQMGSQNNGNGFVIKGWAPQLEILKHRALGGFVTHCGWNSVIESIVSGVVMVAWPMGVDQYSNAQLVVDQLGLGFRVKCDGPKGVPNPHDLARLLTECVSLTRTEKDRVMRLGKLATSTVKSGTSTLNFDRFIKALNECNT